jgi:saccharopine dehydrogenase-like NADP-dependent oxidoreductase
MKSHDYLIIGCGCFGSRAVETLLKKYPRSKIVVVDRHKPLSSTFLYEL